MPEPSPEDGHHRAHSNASTQPAADDGHELNPSATPTPPPNAAKKRKKTADPPPDGKSPSKKPKSTPRGAGYSWAEAEFLFDQVVEAVPWKKIADEVNERFGTKRLPGNVKKHWKEVVKMRVLKGYAAE